MAHKIKIGDEIQAVIGGKWWLGEFAAVYKDGTILMKMAIPLYPIGASYEETWSPKGLPTSIWVYHPDHAAAILTHSGSVFEVLDESVEVSAVDK